MFLSTNVMKDLQFFGRLVRAFPYEISIGTSSLPVVSASTVHDGAGRCLNMKIRDLEISRYDMVQVSKGSYSKATRLSFDKMTLSVLCEP